MNLRHLDILAFHKSSVKTIVASESGIVVNLTVNIMSLLS